MILDYHIHSRYSPDSLSRPADIIRMAKRRGLTAIAITDHHTVAGARAAGDLNDDPNFHVIVGCEVYTEIGDLIGLFLSADLRSRKSLEVIEEIHDQGGLAVLPHPYKWHRLNDRVVQAVDVIEVFNGRTDAHGNAQALALAQKFGKPMLVGSDAHFLREIGRCRVIVEGADVRQALLDGRLEFQTAASSPCLPALSAIIQTVRSHHYHRLPRRIAGLLLSCTRFRRE